LEKGGNGAGFEHADLDDMTGPFRPIAGLLNCDIGDLPVSWYKDG